MTRDVTLDNWQRSKELLFECKDISWVQPVYVLHECMHIKIETRIGDRNVKKKNKQHHAIELLISHMNVSDRSQTIQSGPTSYITHT